MIESDADATHAPPTSPRAADPREDRILGAVREYWGFDALRPLQAEAVAAALDARDSLTILPTGGGKSLCYQVPPLIDDAVDIVVSPLISLMKDQVDALDARGYPAVCIHSNLTAEHRRQVADAVRSRRARLIFVAPERLMTPRFLDWLDGLGVKRIAIDEAHCISQWGHDFRPEYRRLAELRQRFPAASMHAFTATATPRVRDDIVSQLALRDPAVLIGTFDRPNLTYRVLPKHDTDRQVLDAVRRHDGEATIVYCLSRNETEATAAMLRANGVNAGHYHAGMDRDERRRTQEQFANERLDVVAATVAFGMGIDRSNVRCVVHAAMPKSIEHYQQETGRAGRDGLGAECVLLYSAADAMRWESLIGKSAAEAHDPADVTAAALALLRGMQGYCSAAVCRHKALSEYFGQAYEKTGCGACDVCLNEVDELDDASVIAQKVLSCVARTDQRFGIGHIVDVLTGANTQNIKRLGHDRLSTHGILRDIPKKQLTALTYQLVEQGVLDRTEGDRPTLALNDASWQVMKGERRVRLIRAAGGLARSDADADQWAGVDRDLFDKLRAWRREEAEARGVPPFTITHDSVLRDLARVRPTDPDTLLRVKGIGERQRERFGESLVGIIKNHCDQQRVEANILTAAGIVRPKKAAKPNPARERAFDLFTQRRPLDEVAAETGRAESTVSQYLVEWIGDTQPADVSPWVDPRTYETVRRAASGSTDARLKPIHEALGGAVPYPQIRVVLAHLGATRA